MATGPFQSKLEPYQGEIAGWRAQQPPLTYAKIAALLKERHQLDVRPETIFRFVKVRSTRSIYRMVPAGERPTRSRNKGKTVGEVPTEVEARITAMKQESPPEREDHQPFLPPDGRLTYKKKTTT
jgi:hypothetical protein